MGGWRGGQWCVEDQGGGAAQWPQSQGGSSRRGRGLHFDASQPLFCTPSSSVNGAARGTAGGSSKGDGCVWEGEWVMQGLQRVQRQQVVELQSAVVCGTGEDVFFVCVCVCAVQFAQLTSAEACGLSHGQKVMFRGYM